MGITKEHNLIDLVRNGETQAALKILFKNKSKIDSSNKNSLRRHKANEPSTKISNKNLSKLI